MSLITAGTSKFKATLNPRTATVTNKITNDGFGPVVLGVNTAGKLKSSFLSAGTYTGMAFIKRSSGVTGVKSKAARNLACLRRNR